MVYNGKIGKSLDNHSNDPPRICNLNAVQMVQGLSELRQINLHANQKKPNLHQHREGPINALKQTLNAHFLLT
jgi:hypothetical protein